MRRLTLTALLLLVGLVLTVAANKRTTVTQVKEAVTLTDDVDYVITSATPFAEGGSVNIANTGHATVILNAVKPSAAIRLIGAHVTIDGAKAVNNTNCQVKIYNNGAIILPYANRGMLTVYSERDFGGTAVSDFGTENSGGYMNTLTDAKLNNKIRSFRLKRGYMVTFSTLPRGRGYSRCFIAAKEDLEVAALPAVLDGHISSYRVFKWYDTGKKQLAAAGGDNNACSALNVTSTYTWGTAGDMLPDVENVPHHIYENYPSPSSLGACTSSPHMKTNNEPMNTADDPKGKTEDVDAILANWEDLMATGMRLCSPSSWDGSDYTNGTGYLKRFIDSIDARGWRCDIIDLHCYWPEGNFNSIRNWTNSTGRPVWISEWVWGASWNSNGAFASGVTEAQNAAALKRICPVMNNNDCIERYYYWNSERDPSRLYKNGKLTEAGEYYASMNSGVGYNGKYDFVPTTPRQYPPSAFSVAWAGTTATIKWHEQNGEYNQLMQLERKVPGGQWEPMDDTPEQKEQAADYTYKAENAAEGTKYRLHVVDINGTSYYTDYGMAAGDAVAVADGTTRYAGGNLIGNGDFDLGALDWAAGNGSAIGQPYFQVVPVGSIDGGSYLQAYGNGAISAAQSLKKTVALKPGTDYLLRCAARNGGNNLQLNLSTTDTGNGTVKARLKNTAEWTMQSVSFNSGDNSYAIVAFNSLQGKAQLDKIEIRQLFATRDEAVSDGIEQAKKRAQLVMDYSRQASGGTTAADALAQELADRMGALPAAGGYDALAEAEKAMSDLLQAVSDRQAIDSLQTVVSALAATGIEMPEVLAKGTAGESTTAEAVSSRRQELEQALDDYLAYTDAEVQPQSPSFAGNSTTGWQLKVGTHTTGDQTVYTKQGKTCWNAWWSGLNATEGLKKTMEIRQTVEKLPEGIYALECKGSTQHYCIADQHGYLSYGSQTMVTPTLSADYMDLPTAGNIWQTLTTPPVYVAEGGTVTIGFTGSKQGAVNNAWHEYGNPSSTGDRREGWWCATDFRLLFHPMRRLTCRPGEWGTICLPYQFTQPKGIRFYQIAGVLKDHTAVCLEEVTDIPAGKPLVYQAETEQVALLEYGEKTKNPLAYKGENNLWGFFETVARAPIGSYTLDNGTWVKVEGTRPTISSYTSILRTLDGMTELDSWAGPTLPLQDSATGIGTAAATDGAADGGYTLGGLPATGRRGIVVSDGKKRIVR